MKYIQHETADGVSTSHFCWYVNGFPTDYHFREWMYFPPCCSFYFLVPGRHVYVYTAILYQTILVIRLIQQFESWLVSMLACVRVCSAKRNYNLVHFKISIPYIRNENAKWNLETIGWKKSCHCWVKNDCFYNVKTSFMSKQPHNFTFHVKAVYNRIWITIFHFQHNYLKEKNNENVLMELLRLNVEGVRFTTLRYAK